MQFGGISLKKIITLSLLIISLNAFSFESTMLSYLGLLSFSSPGAFDKQAAQIINDSQELLQTGKMTVFLSEKIKAIQAQDNSLSDSEALDILIDVSENFLK